MEWKDMAGFLTLIMKGRYGRFLNFDIEVDRYGRFLNSDIEMEDMAGFLTLILKWKIWQVS